VPACKLDPEYLFWRCGILKDHPLADPEPKSVQPTNNTTRWQFVIHVPDKRTPAERRPDRAKGNALAPAYPHSITPFVTDASEKAPVLPKQVDQNPKTKRQPTAKQRLLPQCKHANGIHLSYLVTLGIRSLKQFTFGLRSNACFNALVL
jgi:hypothetical protein